MIFLNGVKIIAQNVLRNKRRMCVLISHLRTRIFSTSFLNGEIYILEPKYNFQPVHKVYSLRLYRVFWRWKRYYDDATMIESKRNIAIHHCFRYLGQFPWNKNSIHPDVDEFNRYWALSGWSDCLSQSAGNDNEVFKIERKLYRVLPAPVFSGIIQNFL